MTQWGLDTLFNPAKRHMDEEKRRLQSTREEIGDNSGGKRIDLESGKVIIPQHDAHDAHDAHDEPEEPEAPEAPEAKPGRTEPVSAERAEPSPAAVRAARRRGRQPR